MASKNVINRQKSTRMVVAAIRESRARVEAGLSRFFDKDFANSMVAFFATISSFLEQVTEELVRADEELHRERTEDSEARAARDEAVSQLRGLLMTLHEDVRYMYGANAASSLNFAATPHEAEELRRYARTILARLPSWTPPGPPRVAEYRWHSSAHTNQVKEAVARLESALEFLAREQKQTHEELASRNTQLDRHTHAFNLAATLSSHILSLIGEEELARKVRPSPRRAGNTEAVAEEEDIAPDESEDEASA